MADYLNIIIQFILIVGLSVISLLLLRLSKTLKKERRLTKFTVPSLTEKQESFFDKLENIYASLIRSLSKFNKKLHLFDKLSNKYEIYIDQTEKIRKDKMDFISHKILIACLTMIVTIISDVLRVQRITIIQLLFSLVVGYIIPDIFLSIKNKRRKKQIENDLLKAITIMNNAFKTGRSIMQSIELVYKEIDGPISDEFKKMYIDLAYGLDLEEVFNRFALRMNLDEVNYLSSSLVILNKTGGDVVKVFNTIEKSFFERKRLEQELKSATALSSLVYKVLITIPIIIFLVIYLLDNTYFNPLTTTIIGRIIIIIILTLYVLYILIVKKITEMKD